MKIIQISKTIRRTFQDEPYHSFTLEIGAIGTIDEKESPTIESEKLTKFLIREYKKQKKEVMEDLL